LGDVVVPEPPEEAVIPRTEHYDHPSSVREQLHWLADTGYVASTVLWARGDLAVITADLPGAPLRSAT
jgi:hypothetical protein